MAKSSFCEPGSAEAVKGAVHGSVLTLALMCGIYNACAWRQRGGRQLMANTATYAGLALFEIWQVWRHMR